MDDDPTILSVRNLRTYFATSAGLVKAVDGLSFNIGRGRTFALVGESGCGKTVTAYSIMRLLPSPPAIIDSDKRPSGLAPSKIVLAGPDEQAVNVLDLSESQMRKIRGGQMAMIFQEPATALNPVITCGRQIVEAIELHRDGRGWAAKDVAIDMLARMGMSDPAMRMRQYPHQLSGGMRQRVLLAMALSSRPRLLIADEPTSALDVVSQAQILALLRQEQARDGLSILLITHDLAVAAQAADDVGVMYASKLVESCDVRTLPAGALHPYTQALLALAERRREKSPLKTIAGAACDPLNHPPGCKFHPRCGHMLKRCATQEPEMREVSKGHWCACWLCEKQHNDHRD